MTKKLYGQLIHEHNQKNLQTEDDIIEYRQEIEKELVKNIHETNASLMDYIYDKNNNFNSIIQNCFQYNA